MVNIINVPSPLRKTDTSQAEWSAIHKFHQQSSHYTASEQLNFHLNTF